MKYETLKFELTGSVATITLNRPDAANAFNQQLADELLNAAEQCSTDTAIRAVILTGEGRMFCGGIDRRRCLCRRVGEIHDGVYENRAVP